MLQLSRWTFAILAIATTAFATQEEFNKGFTLGQQAYLYGFPLSTMQYTYDLQTQQTPVNQWQYFRYFTTPEFTDVVAPNFDTLYATAWLDLSKGPVVLHLPQELYSTVNGVSNRFWVIPLYDPYTNNFRNLGSVTQTPPGDYAITWRKHGSIRTPSHWTRVDSEYDRVWLIQRIYTINDNQADIQFVNSLQDAITLTPLSNFFFGDWNDDDDHSHTTTTTTPSYPTGMDFYDQLCDQLLRYPPPTADYQFLSTLIPIGIVPGLKPSKNFFLTGDTKAGMIAAVANGSATIMAAVVQMYKNTFVAHNGYLIPPTGTYGTNYTLRAEIAKIGLGALNNDQATYPIALYDRTAKPLLSNKKYQIHIPSGGLPPVNGFWSVTMYTTNGFLVANEINRYVINDRSNLYHNDDGSIDIYIQSTAPTDPIQAQNWLPSPTTGAFELIWRLYALEPTQIPGILDGTGWQPPAVMPVA